MGKMNIVALSMASILCGVMIVYFLIEIDESSNRRKDREAFSSAMDKLREEERHKTAAEVVGVM